MAYAAATKQAKADAVKALGAYISAHTADPGTTGASEASGGGYGRTQTTWTSGSGGSVTGSAVSVTIPAGTYGWYGVWSAASAGTFVGGASFSGGSVTVSGSGSATLLITPSISES